MTNLDTFVFCFLLLLSGWRLSYIDTNYRYFGYGIIMAFIAMAMFNMPYIGKQGIIYFMVLGFLDGQIPVKKHV